MDEAFKEFFKSNFPQTLEDVSQSSHESLKTSLDRIMNLFGEGRTGECESIAAEVAQQAWNQMPWTEVYWREVFIYCQVIAALGCSIRGEKKEAISRLDKAIIVGLPIDLVKEVVDHLNNAISENSQTDDMFDNDPEHTIHENSPDDSFSLHIEEATSIPRVERISVSDFKRDYYSKDTPVIITGISDAWPAHSKWRDLRYFLNRFGHRTVPVEVGRKTRYGEAEDGANWGEKTMTIAEFFQEYMYPSKRNPEKDPDDLKATIGYIAQHPLFSQVEELQADYNSPDYCSLGMLEMINGWIGTAGTVTPLHFDTYDNIFAQVAGCKYIRMYSPGETKKLYRIKGDRGVGAAAQGNISAVDVENVDEEKYPLFSQAKYVDAILRPGDLLYMPAKYWHYVRSLSPSFSLNFWF